MLKQYLLSPLCLKCGSFFCDDSLFCNTCFEQEIVTRLDYDSLSHLRDQHFYLIDWFKNDADFMNEMVYRLKSNNSKSAWKFYAELFFHIHKSKINFKKYQALIPIPGSKKSSVHAHIFSHELAKITGLPICDILIKNTGFSEQKTLKAQERKQLESIVQKSHSNEQFTNCLFVDDILTTGESFLQSKKALNAGDESLILSLFYRPKAL